MNIEFGPGTKPKEGFISCDVRKLENVSYVCNCWEIGNYVNPCTVENIYSRHMFEHLTFYQGRKAITEWLKILKPGGSVNLIMPDLNFHVKEYIYYYNNREKMNVPNYEHSIAGFYGWQKENENSLPWTADKNNWGTHKSGYDEISLKKLVYESGFENFNRNNQAKEWNLDVKFNKPNKLPDHLGGHCQKTHIDDGVLRWAIDSLCIKSFLDIGCGPGGMVELALSKGIDSIGVDGDFTLKRINSNYVLHDYTKGICDMKRHFDLGWSVEFLEHVEKRFIPNYMHTFSKCKYVICTHALPNTPGVHHVNCETEEYWIGIFESYGFKFDLRLSKKLREVSTMNIDREEKKQFIKKTGKVFVNTEL